MDSILISKFLESKSEDIFSLICDKDLAMSELMKQNDTAARKYFLWQRYPKSNSRINILKQSLVDGNIQLFLSLSYKLKLCNKEIITSLAELAINHKRDKELEILRSLFDIDEYILSYAAAKNNRKDLLDSFTQYCDNTIVCGAAEGGCIELLNSVRYPPNLQSIANYSALGGQFDLLNETISKMYTVDYNSIAYYASLGGHTALVIKLIVGFKDKNGNIVDSNDIAQGAAKGGHLELVDLIFDGIKNSDGVVVKANSKVNVVYAALEGGCVEIVRKYMVDDIDVDKAIMCAQKGGNREMLDYFYRVQTERLFLYHSI